MLSPPPSPWPHAHLRRHRRAPRRLPPRASSPAASASTSASASSASGTISGAGSTFQTNFQQGAISAFKSVDSGITVNYNPVGSGTGRTDLYANSVLYAGSDSPIPSKETKDVPAGKTVLYFPVQIGPIAIAYNVSGVTDLKLDATVLAEIFSGKITTWNDPAIKALNPSASLPSTSINLEVRSDSSGTTANFSQYLVDAAGSAWTLGTASTISFPKSAHANDGGSAVAAAVKATSDSIGYVDFSTATATGLTAASIKNSAGDYVAPSSASAAAAATHVTPKANLTFPRSTSRARPRTRSPTSRGTSCTRRSPTPTTRRCSRPTSATCSGPARACSPR